MWLIEALERAPGKHGPYKNAHISSVAGLCCLVTGYLPRHKYVTLLCAQTHYLSTFLLSKCFAKRR